MALPTNKWEVKSHSHQIGDTGDYDGWHELTNGVISLGTKDDDEETVEVLKALASHLNAWDIELFDAKVDDLSIDNHCLQDEIKIREQEWKQKYDDLKAQFDDLDNATAEQSKVMADAYERLHKQHQRLKEKSEETIIKLGALCATLKPIIDGANKEYMWLNLKTVYDAARETLSTWNGGKEGQVNQAAGMPEFEASFQAGYTAGHDAGYAKAKRESAGIKDITYEAELTFKEMPEPVGKFILEQKDIEYTQTANGAYWHYSAVCALLGRYAQEKAAGVGAVWVKATERLPAQGGIDNKVIVRGLLNEQGYTNHHFVAYGFRNFSKVKQEMYFEYGCKSFLTNDIEWLDETGAAAQYNLIDQLKSIQLSDIDAPVFTHSKVFRQHFDYIKGKFIELLDGTPAQSGNEDAVLFAEWLEENYVSVSQGNGTILWRSHQSLETIYTTSQLYDIYQSKNK